MCLSQLTVKFTMQSFSSPLMISNTSDISYQAFMTEIRAPIDETWCLFKLHSIHVH